MITHPEKVLFPDSGITKGELCAYYEAVAPLMLPHITGRPVTMERYPGGHRQEGLHPEGRLEGISGLARARGGREARREGPRAVHYPLASDARSLVWLANQNSITPHVWCSRVPKLHQPDLCVFDLDPPGDEPGRCGRRRWRCATCSTSWGCRRSSRRRARRASTSWSRSTARPTSRRSWRFAHGAGARAGQAAPGAVHPGVHQGRSRAAASSSTPAATAPAPRSRRSTPCSPKPGAPVSAPCTWEEVESGAVVPAHVHAAHDGRPHRRGRRSLARASRARRSSLRARADRRSKAC